MFETIKGLVGKLFPEARVEFAVKLTADKYRTDVENVLRENKINPYGYLYTRQQVLCYAQKNIYESVFKTKLVKVKRRKIIYDYEEKNPSTIPAELQSKVASVELNKTVFHAARDKK
ncbi:MAG: hypothetical protein AABX16_05320 [Nanoarchaeota archaeon]